MIALAGNQPQQQLLLASNATSFDDMLLRQLQQPPHNCFAY